MRVLINSKEIVLIEDAKVADVCSDLDVAVVDGYNVSHDTVIVAGMDIIIVKRGEMPSQDMLYRMMRSRNGDIVNNAVSNACIAVCGLGGLGSNIASMLARLGVGKLILIDYDVVEPTNLNRQDYYISDIGKSKSLVMSERIKNINPYIEVKCIDVKLTADNIMDYVGTADIVVEAFDNPECKAMLVDTVMTCSDIYVVASSGMAGYGSSNDIVTRQVFNKLYVVGDGTSEACCGSGLMSPRVSINAGHQANMVLRILLGNMEG